MYLSSLCSSDAVEVLCGLFARGLGNVGGGFGWCGVVGGGRGCVVGFVCVWRVGWGGGTFDPVVPAGFGGVWVFVASLAGGL